MPNVGREAPNKTHVQSVLIPKNKFSLSQAKSWLKKHDFYTDGIDPTANYYRARQYDPDSTKFDYSLRTQLEDINDNISFVYGFTKENKNG